MVATRALVNPTSFAILLRAHGPPTEKLDDGVCGGSGCACGGLAGRARNAVRYGSLFHRIDSEQRPTEVGPG
jgi:hypothetical protein